MWQTKRSLAAHVANKASPCRMKVGGNVANKASPCRIKRPLAASQMQFKQQEE